MDQNNIYFTNKELIPVTNDEFKEYGSILEGYDYSELFEEYKKISLPQEGVLYIPGVSAMEKCKVSREFSQRGFGGMPVEVGICTGYNHILNSLEYHKSSEFNIAMTPIILILGKTSDIVKGKYRTNKVKAFYVPAGVGVELYSTTLHYAPCEANSDEGFKVICVLPEGTNTSVDIVDIKTDEDRMLLLKNKWLMAHPNSPDAAEGAYIGLEGANPEYLK